MMPDKRCPAGTPACKPAAACRAAPVPYSASGLARSHVGPALDSRHAEHQLIYEALVPGDAAAAREHTEAHIRANVSLIRGTRRD
jgi:DNA-binding GntR family transcriptional regulator